MPAVLERNVSAAARGRPVAFTWRVGVIRAVGST
jgi:hypothetical protein